MYLAPDVFLVPMPDEGTFILYAPLLGISAHVNRALADLVDTLNRGESPGPDAVACLAQLRELGVVSEAPFPALVTAPSEESFEPTSVSLFLTSRCNLGCTYCYADANATSNAMAWPMAQSALDLVFDRAVKRRTNSVGVNLHGGGEATLEWDLLVQIVEYTRARAAERGMTANITIGTNGLLSEARAKWIGSHLDTATVSLDGPPDVHNASRPTVGGGRSYDTVVRTLRIFDDLGLKYGVRMTVTSAWVERLPEAVESVAGACRAHTIQAEPVFPVGRSDGQDDITPDSKIFIQAFRQASAVARRHGRELEYSGARLGVMTDRFCEAAGRSFAVTPTGEVSSCYEVTEPKDTRAELFFWGRYDKETQTFDLDETRRRKQRRLTVHNKPNCQTCFCKWHCAGDCTAKLAYLGDPLDTAGSPRCEVNRALTRDQLLRATGFESVVDRLAEAPIPKRVAPAVTPVNKRVLKLIPVAAPSAPVNVEAG